MLIIYIIFVAYTLLFSINNNKLAFQKKLSCLVTKIRRRVFAMQAGKGFASGQLHNRYVRVIILLNYTRHKSRQLSTIQTVVRCV